jgi:catechol 2,3-dioxygenase-like lactoylglutathione lyase family enzyme
MPALATYRKHAKQLVRWHENGNYSIGPKVRLLPRFAHLSDHEILTMPLPLTLAQEVVAVEAGYADWAALRSAAAGADSGSERAAASAAPGRAELCRVTPILFVRDVAAAAGWYGRLGFGTDFLHGQPPFYGAVSRDGVCLHVRLVGQPNFAELAAREPALILATIEVSDVKALFDQLAPLGLDLPQRLTRQAWGGLDFHVRDPDGNTISFVQYDGS